MTWDRGTGYARNVFQSQRPKVVRICRGAIGQPESVSRVPVICVLSMLREGYSTACNTLRTEGTVGKRLFASRIIHPAGVFVHSEHDERDASVTHGRESRKKKDT